MELYLHFSNTHPWRGAQLKHKMEEMAGDWRRLHNKELHNLYASLNIIRVMK
jgi:hypothetical protein